MEEIKHRTISVNGIKMHVAEKGEGPVVLFLHGFPQLWYSWRHQILALSSLGYHAIAPDLRGYGDTEAPSGSSFTSYTYFHVGGDLIGLIDSLGVEQVYLVAHDFGAAVGWHLCMFRPEKVKAFICLGVPFMPRNPNMKPVEAVRTFCGQNHYTCRFQEPGKMEAVFARIGTAEVLLAKDKPGFEFPKLEDNSTIGNSHENPVNLPSWLSEEDFSFYVTKFDKTGFTGGLNYYRALDLNWELTAAWTGVQIEVPVKLIIGENDPTYAGPVGVKEYIHNGGLKNDVPLLEEIVVVENVGHFINQEIPEEVSTHIFDFINKF